MKTMKVLIMVAVLVAVVYVILLLVFGASVETRLGYEHVTWLAIPFGVSAWWNLMLFPITIMTIVYCSSDKLIVGQEPRFPGFPGEAQSKYQARIAVYLITAVSTLVAVGSMVGFALLSLFWGGAPGPLSSLIIGLTTWAICYFGLGLQAGFLKVLVWDNYHNNDLNTELDESLTLKYQTILSVFVKMGIIKTLPFTLGLTCGYILREIFSKISGLFSYTGTPFAG